MLLAIVVYKTLYAQNTLYWCTERTDFIRGAGPITQPDLHPVAAKIFPAEYTDRVLSKNPGRWEIFGNYFSNISSKVIP